MTKLKNIPTKELEQELSARKAEKDEREKPTPLKKPNWKPLKDECCDALKRIKIAGEAGSESEHEIYEAAMEAVFGNNIWNWIEAQNN